VISLSASQKPITKRRVGHVEGVMDSCIKTTSDQSLLNHHRPEDLLVVLIMIVWIFLVMGRKGRKLKTRTRSTPEVKSLSLSSSVAPEQSSGLGHRDKSLTGTTFVLVIPRDSVQLLCLGSCENNRSYNCLATRHQTSNPPIIKK
jgi:hypothetical protein